MPTIHVNAPSESASRYPYSMSFSGFVLFMVIVVPVISISSSVIAAGAAVLLGIVILSGFPANFLSLLLAAYR